MISLSNINKSYLFGKTRIEVLKGLNLSLAEGEIACLMGPSGSGKTTLLNIIGGLDTVDSGTVRIDNTDITKLSDRQMSAFRNRMMGFVFQSFNLIPVLNTYENVEYPLLLLKIDKKDRKARVDAMLDAVDLGRFKKHKPDEMSGGQRQRIAIARAIVTNPRIVIADEPTANLDHKTGTVIMELMEKLNKTRKTSFLFSTHDPLVSQYAGRTINLLDGVIAQ
jgi:putative ABC transport system ATP-binding protein